MGQSLEKETLAGDAEVLVENLPQRHATLSTTNLI
jgi:hypothetical protein